MFSLCIKPEVTAWIGCAFVSAAIWILVLILSLADQEGQNLEMNAGFCFLYSKLCPKEQCVNALWGSSSAPC